MTDKNTIINGLKNQIHDLRTYADDGEVITLTVDQAEEIVSLLEEQEPVKPTRKTDDREIRELQEIRKLQLLLMLYAGGEEE